MGLQAALLALFIHTFELGEYKVETVIPVIYAFLGILFLAVLFSERLRSKLTGFQVDASMAAVSFLVAGITLTMLYSPLSEKTYMGLFNLIFLGLLVLLLYAGYNTENIGIINTAMFWFIPLIFARYFDFFWELLPRSLFFIVGGLALLAISIGLEKKRRDLKAQFAGGVQ